MLILRNFFPSKKTGFLLFSFLILSTHSFGQEIYKWKDKDGKTHYGQELPQSAKQEKIENRVSEYTPVKQQTTFKALSSASSKVTMYSTATCGYCKSARSFMRKNNITFTEFDVDKSKAAEKKYRALGGKGVPFFVIGQHKLTGFQPQKIKFLYAQTQKLSR